MNVIIANEAHEMLSNLDVDIIKSVDGVHTAEEIVSMFKNFFYARMILDITAIQDYDDVTNIQKLSIGLDADKIILVLPNNELYTSSAYLSKIISMGIYNFTTNLEGIKYCLDHPNTYKDVAHIQQIGSISQAPIPNATGTKVLDGARIFGFKNLTDHAGSTTLIYMIKKELEANGISVLAIEVNHHEFGYFNDKNMISVASENLMNMLATKKNFDVILVDLNDSSNDGVCGDVLYLLEPSILKLNKLMRRNRRVFEEMKGRKLVLNKSLLTSRDVNDFEYEGKMRVFYNIPPLNDREKNEPLTGFLNALGLLNKKEGKEDSGGLFGSLFRR